MKINNEFLKLYLEYVENTETPRLMQVWVALAGIAACLGRKTYLDFGVCNIYPNLYTILVGPPGMRKSTAMNIVEKRLRDSTSIRFAPSDTGGQRQGLIAAMEGRTIDDQKFADQLELNGAISTEAMIQQIGELSIKVESNNLDAHSLAIVASEWSSFIGKNNTQLLTFLGKMFDGEDYEYALKNERMTLINPLLNMLGCTTPTDIADSIPPISIGKGLMSRIILVYGNRKYKKVPRPPRLNPRLETEIERRFSYIHTQYKGPFRETKAGTDAIDKLSEVEIPIQDTRFLHWNDRRQTHLIKMSMCFAAGRLSETLDACDVEEANLLLLETEKLMPEALGEFGMSHLSLAKQRILEFINMANEPVSRQILWIMMSKDMSQRDYEMTMIDLINADKIGEVTGETGLCYVRQKKEESDLLLDYLTETETRGSA